jgi:AraC family transcriptional regulator
MGEASFRRQDRFDAARGAAIVEPFEALERILPRAALEQLEDQTGRTVSVGFEDPTTSLDADPVLYHLARALAAALEGPEAIDALLADHAVNALQRRVLVAHGGVPPRSKGVLAPWQERRARSLMFEDLSNTPALEELAAACGLSAGYFARAFKRTTGLPPHKWLVAQRVAKARELLEGSDRAISDIAAACGFADQSHLTRAFSRQLGASPAAWRRMRRS